MSILNELTTSLESLTLQPGHTPVFGYTKSRGEIAHSISLEGLSLKGMKDKLVKLIQTVVQMVKKFVSWLLSKLNNAFRHYVRISNLLFDSNYRMQDREKKAVLDELKAIHSKYNDSIGSKFYMDLMAGKKVEFGKVLSESLNLDWMVDMSKQAAKADDVTVTGLTEEFRKRVKAITADLNTDYDGLTEPRGLGSTPKNVFDIEDHKRFEVALEGALVAAGQLDITIVPALNRFDKNIKGVIPPNDSMSEAQAEFFKGLASWINGIPAWITRYQNVAMSVIQIDNAVITALGKVIRTDYTYKFGDKGTRVRRLA